MRIELVERFQVRILLPEDVALDPPWEPGAALVAHEATQGHGEDVVELFECPLFGFGHEEEDHDEGADVETTGEGC